MFTGIVQAVGTLEAVAQRGGGARLVVHAGALDLAGVAIGDSICVQGACLTVVARAGRKLTFDVSRETLGCTTGLARAGNVNLEKALRVGDPLGGHLVTGHVDGVATVVSRDEGVVTFRAPKALARYIARKGSVCVDGVSLTVNRVKGTVFEVNLIPHTLEVTTLARLAPSARVNLEIDLLARYVERLRAER